jgi:hypothetical protein
MVGRTLSAVTLQRGAISDNFLRIELNHDYPANELRNIKIGAVSPVGLREASPLLVL